MAPTNSLIPADHTYINPTTFLSCKSEEQLRDLLTKASKRDPDSFGLYIYNDFYNYAILDLIDKMLSTIHTKIVKKTWDEVFVLLEALTIFMDLESDWPMCDDGERVELTNKVYGASVVTLLRALKDDSRLDVAHFPSLETFLKGAAEWGSAMKDLCGGDYYLVCKGIGMRLFKNKSDNTIALEKARVQAWINGLDDDESRTAAEDAIKEDEEEAAELAKDGHVEQPWYHGAKESDEDDEDDDYILSRVWKEYKEHLQSVPTKPVRGPPNWDISKWPQAQKDAFSLDRY